MKKIAVDENKVSFVVPIVDEMSQKEVGTTELLVNVADTDDEYDGLAEISLWYQIYDYPNTPHAVRIGELWGQWEDLKAFGEACVAFAKAHIE